MHDVKGNVYKEPGGRDSFGRYNVAYATRTTLLPCRDQDKGVSGSPFFVIGKDDHIQAVGVLIGRTDGDKCTFSGIENVRLDTTFNLKKGRGGLR